MDERSDLMNYYVVEDERVDNKAASAAQCFLSFWPLFQLDRDPKFLAVVLMLTLQYIIPFDHGCTDSSSLTTSSSSVGTEGIVKVVKIFKCFFWWYRSSDTIWLQEIFNCWKKEWINSGQFIRWKLHFQSSNWCLVFFDHIIHLIVFSHQPYYVLS